MSCCSPVLSCVLGRTHQTRKALDAPEASFSESSIFPYSLPFTESVMKRIISILVLAAPFTTYASGPIDGIYSCGITYLGTSTQAYIAINGQSSGTSVFTVAALGASTSFYGYGIGNATSTNFSGTTMYGLPFNVAVSQGGQTFSGQIGIPVNGATINATTSCTKIF